MIRKTLLVIAILMLIIIGITLLVIAYLLIADIQSKTPKKISQECYITSNEFIGRKIFTLTPKIKNEKEKYILYFHGGSYIAETSEEHWNFLESIVKDTGYTVILPDYPLAPKYTYEDVFTMIKPLYKEIIERISPEDLIMMGDSAGGGMALALEENLSEENEELPSKLILISPWLDTRMENSKIDEVQKNDKDLNKEALKLAGIAYKGKNGKDTYLVNPIDGPLDKLKNVTIYTGTYDILNPDVEILVQKAKEKNVTIDVKEYEECGHIWVVKDVSSQGYKDLVIQTME
mgnify:FL=1